MKTEMILLTCIISSDLVVEHPSVRFTSSQFYVFLTMIFLDQQILY
jgi:hypothetical protein